MKLGPDYLAHQLAGFPTASRYWLAYSGGCDSQVLLTLLAELQQRDGISLAVAHVNHGLLAESDAWAEYCVQQCRALDLTCNVLPVTVNHTRGQSLEAAARQARYAALRGVMRDGDGMLLAHHRDDQAETVLLQLLRGAGVNGLAAMPRWSQFASGWLARPLLDVSRKTISDFARRRNLKWIDDPSNEQRQFDRNFLRHEIMPLLVSRWPAAAVSVSRAADHQADARQCLRELAVNDLLAVQHVPRNELPLNVLKTLSAARQRNLLRYWLVECCGLPGPDTRHLQRVLDEVVHAAIDATPCVTWPGAEVRRYRAVLYANKPLLQHDSTVVHGWDLRTDLPMPSLAGCLRARHSVDGGLDPELIDSARRTAAVTVRFRIGGERCRPVGRGQHHALKKLFQEWGVPPWRRDRVPLVYVGNELAQVVGYSTCEPFQAPSGRSGIEAELVTTPIDGGD